MFEEDAAPVIIPFELLLVSRNRKKPDKPKGKPMPPHAGNTCGEDTPTCTCLTI